MTPTVASESAGHKATRKLATPVEQDHGKREVAHQVGGWVVVENDATPVHASDHADGQDDDQNRDAKPRRQRTDQDACPHQQCADQEQAIDGTGIQRQVLRDNEEGRRDSADSVFASRSRANRF